MDSYILASNIYDSLPRLTLSSSVNVAYGRKSVGRSVGESGQPLGHGCGRRDNATDCLSLTLPWHSANAGEVVGMANSRLGCWQADGLMACEQLLCI